MKTRKTQMKTGVNKRKQLKQIQQTKIQIQAIEH